MTRRYRVVLEWDQEAGEYSVVVPVLPGCASQGRTIEEAIEAIKEAIAGHVATLKEMGYPVPEEPEQPQIVVREVDVAA